jgi:long-chain acyl-CoA synthetase
MGGNMVTQYNGIAGQGTAATDASGTNISYPWLKSYPPHADWFQKFKPVPLPSIFDNAVAKFGQRPATDFLGKALTYAELAAQANRAAKGLQGLGIRKGTNVGLLLPNCPAYIAFYYGILKAGGTVVNFNPLYTEDELAHQAKDAELDTMVTLDLKATYEKAHALLSRGIVKRVAVISFKTMLPAVKSVAFGLLKGKEVSNWNSHKDGSKVIAAGDLLDNDGAFTPVHSEPEDIAVLQYTGGTTGTPKGAMLTHANLSINVQQIDAWFEGTVAGEEKFICVIPFFHVFAMTGLMNFAILKAGQMIMLPRFELLATLKLIGKHKPTIMAGVPTLYNAIMNSPKAPKYDLSSLKKCISGGAPLPLEVKKGFERVAKCSLVEGYGLSETSPVTNINPVDGPVKESSIGLPVPGTIISLRELGNPDNEVPLGEKGEICIAGPQVMKGYWKKPEETANAFIGEFFRTGDVAYMDDEGFAYIVDRIKDLIICSGFNVYPRRIEEAIYEHPAVEEVTVIGIPDDYRGEAPKAYIKLRAGQQATAPEMLQFLETKLSKIEMPSQVEFRAELPKTLIGKLSKKELKAEVQAQKQAQV